MGAPFFGKQPVVARRRRGDPTPAENLVLSNCVRGDGTQSVDHRKGQHPPGLLTLCFELVERGWLVDPGEPAVSGAVRTYRFPVSDKGRAVHSEQLKSFGLVS